MLPGCCRGTQSKRRPEGLQVLRRPGSPRLEPPGTAPQASLPSSLCLASPSSSWARPVPGGGYRGGPECVWCRRLGVGGGVLIQEAAQQPQSWARLGPGFRHSAAHPSLCSCPASWRPQTIPCSMLRGKGTLRYYQGTCFSVHSLSLVQSSTLAPFLPCHIIYPIADRQFAKRGATSESPLHLQCLIHGRHPTSLCGQRNSTDF